MSSLSTVLYQRIALCMLVGLVFGFVAGCGGGDDDEKLTPLSPLYWPQFRGPGGNAVASGTAPTTWNESTSTGIKWKTAVPLQGASSPVICGNKVFLTGADATSREVYCFDATTGDLLWEKQVVVSGSPTQTDVYDGGSENITYAANSVAMDGKNVYVIFGNGDIAAFAHDGKALWSKNLGLPVNRWGHSTSLLAHGNLVIVQLDMEAQWNTENAEYDSISRLLALKGSTGATVWQKTGVDRPVSWSLASPIMINAGSKDQLIVCGHGLYDGSSTAVGPDVFSYNPLTGAEYWRCAALGEAFDGIVPSPVFVADRVVAIGPGFTVAIDPTGSGNVSATHISWTAPYGTSELCSPVGVGQDVFIVNGNTGRVDCLNMADGVSRWNQTFGSVWASPIIIGTNVYLLRQNGTMQIFRNNAGAYESVGTGTVLDTNFCASPAYANGRIYFRSLNSLYCVE